MVEYAGTGGSFDGHDITKRVGKLEVSVDQLHQDSAHTQAALTGLQATVDSIGRVLSDVSQKLDAQRTKRPELGAMAGVATVIIMLGAAVLWPINQRITTIESELHQTRVLLIERAEIIGRFDSDKDYMLEQLYDHHAELSEMKGNRFTKQDGQRLEDKIERLSK